MRTKVMIAATVIVAGIGLTACAKRPGAIVATSVPVSAYVNESCEQLNQELMTEKNNLAALSKSQNSAATGDAIGVFMLGVPASSLLGADKEGDIAVSKGKVNAMELAIKQKNC